MAEYIDNKQFFKILIDYKNNVDDAKKNNKQMPVIPNSIGYCFLMIARRLASKGNFVGYSFKDEMISDGIENCITAINNFNPEKSNNPFAYFTQIIWYAFLRRIEKEKKQSYIKYRSLENAIIDGSIIEGDFEFFQSAKIKLNNEKMTPILEKYNKKPKITPKIMSKNKAKKRGIDLFIEDSDH
jgi:hypothetical protein